MSEGVQMPLPLRWPARSTLEGFLPAGNATTLGLACALVDAASPRQLFVHGPEASGKTHLLLGACQRAEAAGLSVAYLSLRPAGGCRSDLWLALGDPDLICLDDLDAAVENPGACEALFATFNRAHDRGRRLLLASRRALPTLRVVLPDLRSRLAACTQVALRPLDETGQRELLRRQAAERGLVLDDASLEFLFRRAPRRLPALLELLERIDRRALARQRRISPALLREVLGETAKG